MDKSKVTLVISQIIEKIELIVGFCWGGLFTSVALFCMFDDEADAATMIIMWLFAALGIWVFSLGKKRGKMRLVFNQYLTQLSVDPSGSLENLAFATDTSVDVVKKNLQYMIKKKFFTDAFINEQANQLVLPSMAQRVQQQAETSQYMDFDEVQPEFVACTCPHCGGINKIVKGTTWECDFCGSPIQCSTAIEEGL